MNGEELNKALQVVRLPARSRRGIRYGRIERALDLISRETSGLSRAFAELEKLPEGNHNEQMKKGTNR